jgi:anti-sigma factor RsiW
VEEHLRACAACRALAAELRDVQKAVHSLLTVTAPKEMVAQVAKGVEGIAAASGIPVQEI